MLPNICSQFATNRLTVMMMLLHTNMVFKDEYALNSNDKEAYTTLIGLRNMVVVKRLWLHNGILI